MSTWLFGSGGGETQPEDGAAIIKKLASRIESSTLLDDRRDSLRAIKVGFGGKTRQKSGEIGPTLK